MTSSVDRIPIRTVALLTAMVMLVSCSSGCINAQWTKGMLNPDKEEVKYQLDQKVIQKYFFNTVINNPESAISHSNNITVIKDGTLWISMSVKVTLDPIPPQLAQYIPDNIQRYVHVVITMPDGTAWFEKTYNQTGEDSVEIQSPIPGEWVFQVDAVGYGLDMLSYHDGYVVLASAYEPK